MTVYLRSLRTGVGAGLFYDKKGTSPLRTAQVFSAPYSTELELSAFSGEELSMVIDTSGKELEYSLVGNLLTLVRLPTTAVLAVPRYQLAMQQVLKSIRPIKLFLLSYPGCEVSDLSITTKDFITGLAGAIGFSALPEGPFTPSLNLSEGELWVMGTAKAPVVRPSLSFYISGETYL